LNIFDYIIAAIIIYCIIRGIFRGIIKEASSIIGVLAGLYAAYNYYPSLSKDLLGFKNLFPSGEYVDIISFLLLFSIVFLMVGALGILIRFLLKIVFMSWVDRLFGGVFGFVRGFMIASMLVLVLTTFLSSGASVISESVFSPYVASVSAAMSQFAGTAMQNQFNKKMNVAKQSWDSPDGKAPAAEEKPVVKPKQTVKTSVKTSPKTKQTTKPKSAEKKKTKTAAKTNKTSKKKPATKPTIKKDSND
jgi:membrane protein required for colicin V production